MRTDSVIIKILVKVAQWDSNVTNPDKANDSQYRTHKNAMINSILMSLAYNEHDIGAYRKDIGSEISSNRPVLLSHVRALPMLHGALSAVEPCICCASITGPALQ